MGNKQQQQASTTTTSTTTSSDLSVLVASISKFKQTDIDDILNKTWQKYDTDGSDYLDREEADELISNLVQLFFPKVKETELEEYSTLIRDILDADKDGEFRTALTTLVHGIKKDKQSLSSVAEMEEQAFAERKQAMREKDQELYAKECKFYNKGTRTEKVAHGKMKYFATKDAQKRDALVRNIVQHTVFMGEYHADGSDTEMMLVVTSLQDGNVTADVQVGSSTNYLNGTWTSGENGAQLVLQGIIGLASRMEAKVMVTTEWFQIEGKLFVGDDVIGAAHLRKSYDY